MPILTPHSFELLDNKYVEPISQDFTQKEITIFLEDTEAEERTSEPKGKKV